VQGMLPDEMIDVQELERLQDTFCKVTGVAVCCKSVGGELLSKISGTRAQKDKLLNYEKAGIIGSVLDRVREGSLEDQVVDMVGPEADSLAAIALRIDGRLFCYWIVLGERQEDAIHFIYTLDLLRVSSCFLFQKKLSLYSISEDSDKSHFSGQMMSKNLQTIDATASIVHLLDSKEHVEKIIDTWLGIVANHLKLDTAQVFRVSTDKSNMDVFCEYRAPGMVSYFDKTKGQMVPEPVLSDKPLVLSTDTMAGKNKDIYDDIGLQAVGIYPILRREDESNLVLSVNHRKHHNWTVEEVKFTADAVKILQSILTKRKHEVTLANSREALTAILDNVGCAIYVKDKNTGKVLFANGLLQSTFAQELSEGTFEELLQQGLEAEKNNGFAEIYHVSREKWYDLLCKDIAWVDGKEAILYSFYNITDKKIYQRRIEQQAYTDFLTGLYNRMCCERDLARQIDEAQKNGGTGALLYLDLDDFKHINDGLGHQYGDVLLKAISNSLQRIEGIENTCYRMGGDEFVIIIPTEHYADCQRIVADIKDIFVKPWFLNGADYYCTMSMGIVTYPDLGNSVADLIKKADIAMYEAKRGGKNRTSYYREGAEMSSSRRLDMEKNMRDATSDDYHEFEVYYQPIIDVQQEGEPCVGAEALVRWNSSKFGFVPPDEFIPLAEYLGLINPIGNHVLWEACRRCHLWNENGYPNYKVNVNLSVVQLLQSDVVEIVEQALIDTGIRPENLTLEVTESLAINDMERMKNILGRIKALGVKIALDDFGTGYSSLNHIREIPLDVIKVDQIFVKELARDAYSQSFVKMISELAKTLGAHICVEGIETGAQCDIVRDLNVKYLQGFYFGRPMPGEVFEEMYAPMVYEYIED